MLRTRRPILLPGEELYQAKRPGNRALIDATAAYRQSGAFPSMVGNTLSSLVATQNLGERNNNTPVRFGGAI